MARWCWPTPKGIDREAFFRKLLAYGAIVTVVAPVVVWLLFVLPVSASAFRHRGRLEAVLMIADVAPVRIEVP